MYFWDIDKLKTDLAAGSVSEYDTFKYLLAITIIYGLLTIPIFEENKFDVISSIISVPISIIGLSFAYKRSLEKNFLSKYFSIGWVITIRLTVALIPILFIWTAFVPYETTVWDVIVIALIEIIYYWRVAFHIHQVSQSELHA